MNGAGQPRRVAIIGGGWAGCSAAVALADAGVFATLFEQSSDLGGRARRVLLDGHALDNGQHLLLGAYRETLALLRRLHGTAGVDALLHRMPLTVRSFGDKAASAIEITAPQWPAPWHLVVALARARGLAWNERWALMRDFYRLARAGFACPAGVSVAQCFAGTPAHAFNALWAPLCLAALNTPPDRASGHVFARVLQAAFTGDAAGSDFLLPATDLSALLPEPTARHLSGHGGHVVAGHRVRRLQIDDDRAWVDTAVGLESFDAVIVAVGPHQIAHLAVDGAKSAGWVEVQRRVAALCYESITTLYLAYESIDLPAPIARLDDAPGQWILDRGALPSHGTRARMVAVVISAGGPHDAAPHATLVTTVDAQLRRLQSGLGPLCWGRVIAERRATHACAPDLDLPPAGRIEARLHLAGDYTDHEFPATLEAAVRSGGRAARSVLDALAKSSAGA